MFAVTFRRYYCVAIPSWVADFTRDAGGVVSKTATAYQFRGWEGADAETKVKLAKGELSKKYHKILVKDPISFCTPLDNPVESTPEMDCSLWWDAEDDTQRLYLQLGPQFPPLLWFPIKPSSSTVSRIFDDFEQNNTKYLESATPHYEAYLSSGSLALESSELKDSITPQISSHSTSPQSTTTVSSNQIVSWAAPGEVGDLYRRTAGLLSSLTIKREYENNIWYHLGSTVSPEEVESKMNKNSFLFTRYPMTVISGEQRTKPGPRPVLCTTYRTIFSKSIIMFTTRDDEPHINVTVSNKKYDEESGLYCCVDHPSSVRMSGGAAVVERFNREFGTDYPITTPVDVLGALALFRSKALSQIEKEYNVVAGTFFGGTKDAVAEVARRQQLTLPEEDQKYLNDLKTLAHSSDSAIADDASHPVNSQVLQYIRRLAIMKYPDFEQKCFLPFWNLPSKHIRVKVHEACCIAGRPDLADLLLSRESDEYVVKQIAFTEGKIMK